MTEQDRQAIDLQAIESCRKMSDTERAKFFATTKRDNTVGHCYGGQRFPEFYMDKGPADKRYRVGQRREVYEFDAREVGKLWAMITPFISGWVSSVMKKRIADPDVQDVVSAVLEDLTYTLRFEGPVPRNKSFTYALEMACNQVVTICLKGNASPSAKILRDAISINEVESTDENEDGGDFNLVQDSLLDFGVAEEILFAANEIPEDLEIPIEMMLGGEPIYRVAVRPNGPANTRSQKEMEVRRLRREVSKLVSDDGEPMEQRI